MPREQERTAGGGAPAAGSFLHRWTVGAGNAALTIARLRGQGYRGGGQGLGGGPGHVSRL